ncbi:MAG TPA: sialidase family protein, partial [Planctomycetota bacterium]|nr:sialidase family protein [Planctomycetota bacterium]
LIYQVTVPGRTPQIAVQKSDDGGITWTEPALLTADGERPAYPSLLVFGDKVRALVYRVTTQGAVTYDVWALD